MADNCRYMVVLIGEGAILRMKPAETRREAVLVGEAVRDSPEVENLELPGVDVVVFDLKINRTVWWGYGGGPPQEWTP